MRDLYRRNVKFLGGIGLGTFAGADLYVWLADVQAPLQGPEAFLSGPLFWDSLHAATLTAVGLAVALVVEALRGKGR